MCYCPTPTLHLNVALTGDGAFIFSLKKTHSVWFISVLNYGDTENVLINHLLLVIPMSYPCHYTNLCPHKPHKHAHTHTHTNTHTHTHTTWQAGQECECILDALVHKPSLNMYYVHLFNLYMCAIVPGTNVTSLLPGYWFLSVCDQSEIKKSNTVISLHKRSELIWVIAVKNKQINMKAGYLKKTAVLF